MDESLESSHKDHHQKAQALIEEANELKRQIEEKLSRVQSRTGFSLKELRHFFEVKSNFSEKQWNDFQKEKKIFENTLATSKIYRSKKVRKSASEEGKKKKGKKGRQRKNWLSL